MEGDGGERASMGIEVSKMSTVRSYTQKAAAFMRKTRLPGQLERPIADICQDDADVFINLPVTDARSAMRGSLEAIYPWKNLRGDKPPYATETL